MKALDKLKAVGSIAREAGHKAADVVFDGRLPSVNQVQRGVRGAAGKGLDTLSTFIKPSATDKAE